MKNISLMGKSRLAVLAAFFTNGALMATWVSRIPATKARLEMTDSALGLVLLGLSFGVLTSLSISGSLIARFGSKKVTLTSAAIMGATIPLLALAPHTLLLFLGLFVFGASLSAMDVAMNEQAVLVERKAQKKMMSSFHAGYSVGGLIGALIGALMASQPQIPLLVHFFTASVIFCSIVFSMRRHFIAVEKKEKESGVAFSFPHRSLWLLGAIAFCSMLAEVAMGDWSGVYLTQVLQTSSAVAALGYAANSLTMTIGRLLGDAITRSHKPSFVIKIGALTAIFGLLLLVLTNSPAIAISGFALIGLGLSNIIPVTFSAAGNKHEFAAGAGIAGVATIGYCSALTGPPMIGFIAEGISLRAAMLAILLLVATLPFSARGVD